MDRRDSIKSLLVGSLAGGLLVNGCAPDVKEETKKEVASTGDYGRTPEEKERDAKLQAEQFFNEHELTTIAILCDINKTKNDQPNNAPTQQADHMRFIRFLNISQLEL